MPRSLTYSHALLLPLTRACGARCSYCTFRTEQGSLLTFDEIETIIRKYQATGVSEAVLACGQSLDEVTNFSNQWAMHGCSSFTDYLKQVCQLILEHQLLPSLDVGPLSYPQLEALAPYVASITAMIENVNVEFMATVQQNKRIDDFIETITDAAVFGIPVHTGILIGAGETMDDSFATLHAIDELCGRLPNIQSVRLQSVHLPDSTKEAVAPEMISLLSKYVRKLMPEINIVMPISSPAACWTLDGIVFDDLGWLFEGFNGFDWSKPQPRISEVGREMAGHSWSLKPRLPFFEGRPYGASWSSELAEVADQWCSKREFAAYRSEKMS